MTTPQITEAQALAAANAAMLDPKVAAYRATYHVALDQYKGGAGAGGTGTARQTMEMAKAAWQKALREFVADYLADVTI
jgi:hypothetical protein